MLTLGSCRIQSRQKELGDQRQDSIWRLDDTFVIETAFDEVRPPAESVEMRPFLHPQARDREFGPALSDEVLVANISEPRQGKRADLLRAPAASREIFIEQSEACNALNDVTRQAFRMGELFLDAAAHLEHHGNERCERRPPAYHETR